MKTHAKSGCSRGLTQNALVDEPRWKAGMRSGIQARILDPRHEQHGSEQHDDDHHEVAQPLAVGRGVVTRHERGDEGTQDDSEGLGRADHRTDGASLGDGHLVGQHCRHGGVRGVEGELRQCPPEHEPADRREATHEGQDTASRHRRPQHPGAASSEPGGGAVGEGTGQRARNEGDEGTDCHDDPEVGLLGCRVDRLDLERQEELDRGEERRPDAEVGQREDGDEAPADPGRRLGQRVDDRRRGTRQRFRGQRLRCHGAQPRRGSPSPPR